MTSAPPCSDPTLQILGHKYIDECGRVMAQAFRDASIYKHIFRGDSDSRVASLEWLFVRNILLVMSKSPSALRGILNDQGDVVCCFLWVSHEVADASVWEMIQYGLWQMPFLFGLSAMNRMLQILDDMKASDRENIAVANKTRDVKIVKQGSIHLERMVVRPDYQGQGFGSKALREVLAKERAKGNINLHLETQSERNVTFYKKLGYEVVYERDYYSDDEEYKFHLWYLVQIE